MKKPSMKAVSYTHLDVYKRQEYGTGAIMGVPAHDQRDFDFARKYSIDVIPVINPPGEAPLDGATMTEAFDGDGIQCNSGIFDGMPSSEALPAMKDWFVSHGWGEKEVNLSLIHI